MIVLDTHIWLWWMNNDITKIGHDRLKRIEESDCVAVSIISCFEVAWLARHGRIKLPCNLMEWFAKSLESSGITLLPLTPPIVVCAVELPEHHRDPQDRLIIATALTHTAILISSDKKFQHYSELLDILF